MTPSAATSTVLYLLNGYPVLSETFVVNEVASLREAGAGVAVLALLPGDPDAVDPVRAGEYALVHPASWVTAARSWWWWLRHRPGGVGRLVRRLVTLRGSDLRFVLTQLPQSLQAVAQHSRVSAVHSHFAWRASTIGLYAACLLGARTSVTVHADDLYRPSADLDRRFRLFDAVVTVCAFNVQLSERRGYRTDHLRVVPCGVDVPVGPLPAVQGKDLVSVGRLVSKKGYPDLVGAFAQVTLQHPDAHLEIIGDGPLREHLESTIERLGIGHQVTLTGARPHSYVLRRLTECTALVLASKADQFGSSDALPVAIREAMARGRPVISTRLAGIPETLQGVGWLADPGDTVGLAEAMIDLLDHPDVAAARGAAGRERTLAHYTLAHTTRGMQEVLGLSAEKQEGSCAS